MQVTRQPEMLVPIYERHVLTSQKTVIFVHPFSLWITKLNDRESAHCVYRTGNDTVAASEQLLQHVLELMSNRTEAWLT
jgi:hypothetical protein